MKKPGVFTIGASIEAAVKAAVMVEDVARTAYYACNSPPMIAVRGKWRAHQRYVDKYGQAQGLRSSEYDETAMDAHDPSPFACGVARGTEPAFLVADQPKPID